MKKFYQITLTTLLSFASLYASAQSGIYESYVILSINGGANAYYDMQATTGNPDFQGANLGNFSGANTLTLKGGENKTFKCAPCDITNGSLWYRVYQTGTTPGSFSQVSYFFGSNLGSGCGGNDQSWNATGSTINLLSGLSPGNYTVEVYSTADYQGCGTGTHYSSNSGNNYKATFNFCGSGSGALPAGSYSIPGCFATVNAAASYITTNGVSGAVIFNVAAGHTETAPVNGIQIGTIAGASATNTITFQKSGSGANPTITAFTPQTAGGRMDGVIRLVGADFVTIDGFTLQENGSNTVLTPIGSNTTTEFGIGIFGASATNGSQNNTIKNCTISMGSTNPSATGIFSTSTLSTANAAQTASSAAGLNSDNKFYSNTISNVNYGFIIICPTQTSTLQESGIEIGGSTASTGNSITYGLATGVGQTASWSGVGTGVNGIMLNSTSAISIRYNTITSTLTSNTATDHTAILFRGTTPSSGTFSRTISNNTITLNNSATTAVSTGINLGYGLSTGAIDVSSNTITINKTSGAANAAAISGIIAGYAASGITIAGNTLNLNTSISVGSYTGAITGISVSGTGTASTTVNINSTNTIKINQSASGTGSYGSGAITYINASYAATGAIVNVTNNSLNTTSSTIRSTGALIGVNCEATNSLFNIKSNSFVIDRVAASGAVNFTAQSGTPSNLADTVSNNTITLTGLAGSTSVTAIGQLGGTSASIKNVCNNTISITGTNTGTVLGVTLGYGSGHRVSGNSITVSTASATINGFVTGANYGTTNANTVRLNTISLTSSATSGSELTGIKISVGGNTNVVGNTISTLNFSGAASSAPSINGIWCSVGSNNVYQNSVSGLSFTGTTGGPTIRGIVVSAGTTHNIYRNKVYGLTASGTTGNVSMYGIGITGGTTATVYNNLVSGLSMTTAQNSNGSPLSGIFASGTGTHNIYNNTVYISGTTSGSIFYSAGLYSLATATAVDVRNNIIVNECTPVGAGAKAAAFYRSGTSTANISSNSNKNFYFAGTPSASNCIYFDITNTDQAITDYQTRVSPKEAGSFTEAFTTGTYFTSLTGSNAGFLHIPNGLTTQLESGATTIGTVTDDYDGQTRPVSPGTAPDVGACEFNGTSPAPVITFNSLSPLGNQCTATAHTVSVNVVPTAGTTSSVNITFNNGSSTGPVAMTNTTGTTWTYSIPAASPANTSVTYSIVATNSVGVSTTYTGTAYADAPAFGVTATAAASPSTVCSGSPTSLTATIVKNVTVSIGAGGTTGTAAPYNPFNGGYGGMKGNYLIRASELTAAGLSAGNITAIALDFSAAGTTYNGFGISMGHTALTALTSSTIQSGLTSVFTATSVTPTVGVNTYTLTTPFNWDGTSNIIIATCWSNNNASNANATVRYDATSFQSSVSYRQDNATSSTICSFTGATGSGTNTFDNASNRPKFVITGNAAPTATAFSWSDGSTVVGTSNPLSQSPTSNTTYTCTATVSGCPVVSSGAAVTVNSPTASPTNTSVATQCGTSAIFSISTAVSSPTIKWYTAASGGTAISGATSTTYTATGLSAGLNSRWATVTDATGCESARVQCDVTLASADALTATVSPTGNICLGNPISLSVTQSGSNGNVYTLTWQAAGAGSGLTSNTSGALSPASLSVTPTAAGTYNYLIDGLESSSGCASNSSVSVTVINPTAGYTATASATPSTVCSGTPTSLNLVLGVAGTATVGAGGTTGTGAPYNPFNGGYGGMKGNYLIRASELTAAGLVAGNITAIALDFSGAGTTYNGFGISMGHTALTALTSSTIQSGLTSVYTAASVTPTVGVNTYTLTTPFNWDGSSNIIIATCWSNNNASNTNATVRYDATSFQSSVSYRKDNETSSNICAFTGATGAGTFTYDNSSTRPKFVITGVVSQSASAYSWSDGSTTVGTTNPLSQSPTSNTSYTCTATISGCPIVSNSVPVTVNPPTTSPTSTTVASQCGTAATFSISTAVSSPIIKWYTAASGGSAIAGATSTTYTATGLSAGLNSRWATVTDASGCESARVQCDVTLSSADVLTAAVSPTGNICLGNSISLSVSQSGGNGNTYALTWQAAGAGSGLTSNTSGSLSPVTLSVTPTAVGTYSYAINGLESGTGCAASSSVSVTVVNPTAGMTATATNSPTSFCPGSSTSLNLTIGSATLPSGYCGITAGTSSASYFNSFSTTGGTSNITNSASGYSTNGYGDFTSLKVVADRNASITFNTSLVGTTVGVALWVDWNQNGTFETSERMYQTTGYSSTATASFTVPVTASYGVTRMRILMDYNTGSPSNPCGPFASGRGEVEDYTFQVAPTGFTYSWSDGSTVVGTTNPLSVTPPVGTTNYTCTATLSGCSITSNTLAVSPNSSTLSGTYTVGTAGTYPTITAAVAAWNNACAISGHVIFSLLDATYPSETFPITLNEQPLSGPTKTLTIKPASGVTTSISGSNANSLFVLNGADYITFDGSNNGSTSRNLTIANTNTGASALIFKVNSVLASSAGATNNTLKNMVLTGSGRNNSLAAIYQGGETVPSAADFDNNNNTYSNNVITASQDGIIALGSAAGTETGLTISDNTLGHASTNASRHAYEGIFVSNETGFTISGNAVLGVQSNFSGVIEGILVGGLSTNGTISKNTVSYVNNNSTLGYTAAGITLTSSATNANITVSNNIISGIVGYGYSGVYWNGHGLLVNRGTGYNIYHNTIALSTNQTIAGTTAGIFINSTSSTVTPVPAGLDIRNNIFTNTQTTGATYAIYAEVANTAFSSINNNVYFSSGANFGYLGSAQSTLAGWQGVSGQDANSLNVAPVFVSSTNYHLNPSANSTLDGAGATGTGVTSDIDGDVRCPGGSCPGAATNPDPGADEFEVPTCLSPSAVTASNITSTGVGISWTAPSPAPTVGYEWLIVATGAGSGGTPIATTPAAGAVTGTSVTGITGLTASTTYDIWVRSDCGSGLYSSYVGPITFTTRPANDECLGAVSLTVNASNVCTSTTSGTSVNASQSQAACSGAGTADDDVWYSFTALGTAHTVTITAGTITNLNFEVFSGACGSLTSIACINNTTGSNAETTGLTGLSIGATYYVRVFSNANGTGQGTFTVCVSSPPANDACANATALPCGTTGLAGTTNSSISESAPFGCANNLGVWYTFTGDGTATTVTVTPTGFDVEITVGSGSCGSLTQVSCTDNTGSGVAETVTFNTVNGTTYYIYVAHFSTSGTTTGDFTISRSSSLSLSNTGTPATGNIPVGTTDAVIAGFQLSGSCTTFDVTGLTYTTSGTATTSDVSNLRIYRDVNNNGTYQSGTDVLASSSALSLSASLVFTITGQTGITGSARYLLVGDIAVGATIGRTITGSITPVGNITVSTSPSASTSGTAVGNTQTISAAAPSNDLCSNATALPCGTNALAGTTNNCISESAPFGCANNLGVWYTFTGDGSPTTISVTPTGFDVEITVGSGSCGSLTQVSCTDNTGSGVAETVTFNTVNGTTYYIYVAHFSTSGTTTGNFTISRAASLALSNTGTPATGNIGQGVSNSLISGFQLAPACASYSLTGVTFTTTGTATTADLSNFRVYRDVNNNGTYESGTDVLASSSAQALAASITFTITGQTSISASGRYLLVADVAVGATVGRTIVASVTSVSNITYSTVPSVTATGTATGNTRTISGTPPANDDCAGATPFATIPTDGSCVNLNNQSTANALASGVTPSGTCTSNSGTPDDDVWYSFVAPGPSVIVNFTYVSGATDIYWQAFSGSCGSTMTSIACSDANAGGTLTGLTTGATYYIRLYTFSSAVSTVQNICLQTPPPPPSNDLCSAATTITCSTTGLAGTTVNTVPESTTPPVCSGSISAYGVWYTFAGNGQTTNVTATPAAGYDLEVVIYSGSCGSLTALNCADNGSAGAAETATVSTTNGTTYYVYVAYFTTGTTTGTFTLSVNCIAPITNDNCGSATTFPTIPTDGSCASLSNQTTIGATASGVTPTGSCTSNFGTPDDDVWYSFVASATSLQLEFTNVSGATDIYWQIFSGACGATMTSIRCSDADLGGLLTGLSIGQTYYLRLYSYSSGVSTTQNICIRTQSPNDDCAGATPLTYCAAPVTGNVLGATESTPDACGTSYYWYDLWYSFVAEATTSRIRVTSSSGFDAVVELFDACGGTLLYCRDNNSSGGNETINATGLTVGNTYYVRVYAYDDGYYVYPTTYTFTVAVGRPGYWTGAVSTDWNTSGNWCDNNVPTATDNVTIPNQTNDPIVGAYTANCANFTILSGATFGFSGGVASSTLIINGSTPVITTAGNTFSGAGVLQIGAGSAIATMSGGATFNNDRVTISSNSTLKLNGSADFNIGRALRVNSGANVYSFGSNNTGNYPSTPNATAYLRFTDDGTNNGIIDYNTGSANGFVNGQVKSDRRIAASNQGYRYISAPLQGTISQWADDFTITGADGFVHTGTAFTSPWPTLWQYDESNTNTNMAYGWVSNTNSSNVLDRATGYAAITPGGITLDLTGPLQVPTGIAAGTISKAVTSTSSGQPLSDGWNLIGNPYQAPLNFVSLRSSNSSLVAAYAYYWVSNGTYTGNYGSYNALTGISANGGTQFVAPHQGFMVRANANGNVSFNNGMTGNSTAYAFLKSEGPSAEMPIVRLSIKENGKISDEVVVASHSEAKNNVSNDPYDTDKFFTNEESKPELYLTDIENTSNKLAVSTLSELTNETVVPIGLSHVGVFTTVITEMANIPTGVKVYLEDKKLNQYVELHLGDALALTKTDGEASEGRYFLRFGNEDNAISAEDARMIGYSYVSNGNIQINLLDAGINPSSAKVMDISGKLIGNFQLNNNNGVNSITSVVLAPGVYLVDVKTDKGTFVNKVVVPGN